MTQRSVVRGAPPAVWAVLLLVAVHCGAAQATRGSDLPPPTPQAVRAANPASVERLSRRAAAPAAALREGRVTAVDEPAGRIEIDGHKYVLAAGRTRFYQQGVAASPAALSVGQQVGFALSESADAAAATPADRITLSVVDVR